MRRLISFLVTLTFLSSMMIMIMIAFNWNSIMPMLKPVDVLPNLPKLGTGNHDILHDPIVQLRRNDRGFCTAFVVDGNYALTAAHCIRDGYSLQKEPIQIFDRNGKNTGIIAQPAAIHNRIDIALVKGDFTRFSFFRVDFYGFSPTNAQHRYQACGFPGLQNQVSCTLFIPTHNMGFSLAGRGFLIPGMSGGPVIDMDDEVVIGINSAAINGFVLIAPTLGLAGAFGIENEDNN